MQNIGKDMARKPIARTTRAAGSAELVPRLKLQSSIPSLRSESYLTDHCRRGRPCSKKIQKIPERHASRIGRGFYGGCSADERYRRGGRARTGAGRWRAGPSAAGGHYPEPVSRVLRTNYGAKPKAPGLSTVQFTNIGGLDWHLAKSLILLTVLSSTVQQMAFS